MSVHSPVVIGGAGGSGTRVYHLICTQAGYTMSRWNTGASFDCLPLARWVYPRWTDRYLGKSLSRWDRHRMRFECRFFMRLANPLQGGRWGWKNPRSLYLIEFFDRVYPTMHYIQVVRDGRDIAFNPRFDYRLHEAAFLSPEERRLDDPRRKALHWARLNRMGEDYGRGRMKERHFLSRFEHLCANPQGEIRRIHAFLGVEDESAVQRSVQEVTTPRSLGRWQNEPPESVRQVEELIGDDLVHYGYPLASGQASRTRPPIA